MEILGSTTRPPAIGDGPVRDRPAVDGADPEPNAPFRRPLHRAPAHGRAKGRGSTSGARRLAAAVVMPRQEASPRLQPEREQAALDAVRNGDLSSYDLLYDAYVAEARRRARRLVAPSDVEDLVSEAFARVLQALVNGHGPTDAFGGYLHVAINTTAARLHRRTARAAAMGLREGDVPTVDAPSVGEDQWLEGAFASLSPRWRQVLWWTVVEGRSALDVAGELGLTATAAAALSYRARAGLRAAYLARARPDQD